MHNTKFRTGKIAAVCTAAVMMASSLGISAFAAETPTLEAGKYTVNSNLSCYVTAMGGVEFGKPLLTKTEVTVNEDGTAKFDLSFTKSSVTIYSVTCDTFVDASADGAVLNYKDGSEWKAVDSYKLSTDTALNSKNESVNYVESISFTVSSIANTYNLGMYVNSNVMGVQFGGSDSANYAATLTVDWSSAAKIKTADKTSSQSATVKYNVEEGYEVSIPAEITVDTETKTANYSVQAKKFVLPENAYVTVTANENGSLSNGKDSLAFTNELATGNLTKTGDNLNGKVTVTDEPASAGEYTGTVDFTINYFAK
jgi:hypothetical protein